MTATTPALPAAAPAPRAAVRAHTRTSQRRIGEKWYTAYLFILPHFAVFMVGIALPFFFSIAISFFDYNYVRSNNPFVGLQNYQNLATPGSIHFGRFWETLWNTILFVLLSTPTLVIAGLFLAVLLNGKYRGRNLFRAIYFAPWTLGVGVVGLLWYWVLSSQTGLLSLALNGLGLDSPGWLIENPWAWLSILLATLWWTIGFNTIILLAGLQSISIELYEAAAIDGANKWQQFRHITVPSLRPILLLVVTLQVIASFNLVGQPQIMTGGGPGNETRPVLLYIFETGFQGQNELGQAAAMALIVAIIMVIVSVINFRVFRTEQV
jgi:multiple sugar transport system permease protein